MTRTACNLNRIPMLLLSAVLAAALFVPPRLHATEAGYSAAKRSLTLDCDKRFISQRQASWLLGSDNFSQAYARRAALHAETARACADGVAAVRVEGKRMPPPVAQLSRR